jgi:hypothetical protein
VIPAFCLKEQRIVYQAIKQVKKRYEKNKKQTASLRLLTKEDDFEERI